MRPMRAGLVTNQTAQIRPTRRIRVTREAERRRGLMNMAAGERCARPTRRVFHQRAGLPRGYFALPFAREVDPFIMRTPSLC